MDADYSNRELDAKFQSVADTSTSNAKNLENLINNNDKDYRESLGRIETQTVKTNGRVSSLEDSQVKLAISQAVLRTRINTSIAIFMFLIASIFIPLGAIYFK